MTAPAPTSASSPASRAVLHWPVRLLGCVLALLVTDPTVWLTRPASDLLLPLLALGAAFVAAAPLTARPVNRRFHWYSRIARHRNTVFAVGCVLLATLDKPPTWLAACDAALLLSYLLCVDAAAAGPPGARLLRRPLTLLAAYGATALVFVAAFLPVTESGPWGRLAAALAIVVSAAATVTALWARGGGVAASVRGPRPRPQPERGRRR